MVRKLMVSGLVSVFLAAQSALASGGDLSEKGVPTSPLKIYTCGIGAGALMPQNDELKAEQKAFGKLSIMNNFYFRNDVSLFLDLDWFFPGNNFGANAGFDFMPFQGDIRPFIGAGVGAHYFDRKNSGFGDNFGPSGTVHLGLLVDITDQVQLKLRIPFHLVGNEPVDNGIGVDIGMMFGSRFRTVKKLDYNKM